MSFGALSTLLGQLPVITTTITNCVLMSKMMKQFSGSNTAGGYDLFGTSSTTNPYTGLDWFQPKYSNTEDKDETPSAPVNYDKKYEGYDSLTAGTIDDTFVSLNKQVNDGNINFQIGSDGKWTQDTMSDIKEHAGNTEIRISDKKFSSAEYVTNVRKNAAKTVKEFDTSNDGLISFEEYKARRLAGVSEDKKEAVEKAAKEMFDKLDIDGSGKIGHEEIASYLAYLDQGVYDKNDKASAGENEDEKGSRNGIITSAEYLLNSESLIMETKESARATLKANWNLLFGEAATKARAPRA